VVGRGCVRRNEEEEDVQLMVGKRIINSDTDQGSDSPFSSPLSGRTRAQLPKIQSPLWQVAGAEGQPALLQLLFSTSDLLNWKESVESYRENLGKM